MRDGRESMRVLITGATGFVGRALVQRLLGEGCAVLAWVRDPERALHQLGPSVQLVPMSEGDAGLREALSRCDGVINLAGESVIGARWSGARKQSLRTSRVDLTERLVRAIEAASPRPAVLVSASAVGYYGDRGEELLSEKSEQGSGFLAELCADWERAALGAESAGVRVALLRIGIVLGLSGGALAAMLPAFELGLGGRLGNGRQFMPWITLNDLIDVLLRALRDERMRGPFNATAPRPVDNREFAATLARVLHKPAFLPVPTLALHAVLGERAQVVLQSQRARPVALERLGHVFDHDELEPALRAVLEPLDAVAIRRAAGDDGLAAEGLRPQHVLETETWLDAPIDRAFEFFCRAENLGLITPSFMRFAIVGDPPRDIEEGTLIRYRIRVGPLPLSWTTRIKRWSPPSTFVDQQIRGPYALWWHEHVLEDHGARTRMVDRVRYALPLPVLGTLAHAAFVRRMLRAIFAYRAEAIGRLFDRPEARAS